MAVGCILPCGTRSLPWRPSTPQSTCRNWQEGRQVVGHFIFSAQAMPSSGAHSLLCDLISIFKG